MSWQLLVGLSVLFYSVNGLLHRILMKDDKSDAYAQTVVFNGLVGLFACTILLFRGGIYSFFSLNQLLLFLPMVFINAIALIFGFKGMKLIEASEHTILLTSSKLWLITGAILFLNESFSLQKLIGAIAILLGVAVAEWRKKKFVFNQGAFYVLIAAMFFAISEIICYFILRNFDATLLIVYSCFVSVVIL
ncbi:MAG: DMT family transporter, partial [Candidatus Beckwithbacteria bacterium]